MCARRCPHESGALFLYRKLPTVPEPVLFAAPPLVASEEHMEGWLKEYNDALASVDPEAPRQVFPPRNKEAAGRHPPKSCSLRSLQCLSIFHLKYDLLSA